MIGLLQQIKTALEALGRPVFYGQAGTIDGADLWDYIVFWRETLESTGGKTGYRDRFIVSIVQEEFVDDETVEAVIKAMKQLPGVKLSDGQMQYAYTKKPNTETVIEILALEFLRARKVDA